MHPEQIMPAQALERILQGDCTVLDVRTRPEWIGGRIPGAVHIPLDELTRRWQELDPDRPLLVVCQHGIRSAHAAVWLAAQGFSEVANIRYGMSAWPGPIESGGELPASGEP